jgi:hypothetical protein
MNTRRPMRDDLANADGVLGPDVSPRSDQPSLDGGLGPQGSQWSSAGRGERTTRRRTVSGREQDPACSDNEQVDHGKVATLGSAMAPLVDVEHLSTQLSNTALQQTETGIVGTSRTGSASTSSRGVAVPRVIVSEGRADFLAGWTAGQAAAAACGPLPDEIARNVVLILDSTTSTSESPRRPR